MSDLQTIINSLNGQVPGLRSQELELQKKALEDPAMSGPDALYSGLVGLAPLIAGAIKGGKYIKKGAEAGLMGTALYGKDLKEKQDKEQKRALLEASSVSEERKALEKRAQDLSDFGLKEDVKLDNQRTIRREFGSGDHIINNYLPGEKAATLSDSSIAKITEPMEVAGIGRISLGRLDDLQSKYPEIKAAYKKPDGSLDAKGAKSLMSQAVSAGIFGSEEARGKATSDMLPFILAYQKYETGLTGTDSQMAQIREAATGKGLAPEAIPTAYEAITKRIEELEYASALRSEMYSMGTQPMLPQERSQFLLDFFKRNGVVDKDSQNRILGFSAPEAYKNSITEASVRVRTNSGKTILVPKSDPRLKEIPSENILD